MEVLSQTVGAQLATIFEHAAGSDESGASRSFIFAPFSRRNESIVKTVAIQTRSVIGERNNRSLVGNNGSPAENNGNYSTRGPMKIEVWKRYSTVREVQYSTSSFLKESGCEELRMRKTGSQTETLRGLSVCDRAVGKRLRLFVT